MSGSPVVAVALFQSYQEASMAQAALTAESIESELVGGVTADTLAYIGSATGGVRLLVREKDASRAARILDGIEHQRNADASLPPWRCAGCGEEVEGAFDVCWSCGHEKPGLETDAAAAPVVTESVERSADAEDGPNAPESAEAMVERAWRAAVLGIALFPLLAYALVLLLRASRRLPQRTSWKFYGAILIVCGMGFFWWAMLSGFFWRL